LPKTVTRQRRDCDLNPGPSAPESSTLATRLPSHSAMRYVMQFQFCRRRHITLSIMALWRHVATAAESVVLPNFQVHRYIKVIPVVTYIDFVQRPTLRRTRYTNRLNSGNNRGTRRATSEKRRLWRQAYHNFITREAISTIGTMIFSQYRVGQKPHTSLERLLTC